MASGKDASGEKAQLYATAGIAESWVADAGAAVLYQMWSPLDGAYAEQRQTAFGLAVEAVIVTGIRLELPHA